MNETGLYDITISKLDQKSEIGPNWNGWNISVSCKVHTDTFTTVDIHTDYVMEVNEALQELPYVDKMVSNTIDLENNNIHVVYSFEIDADTFRADLLEHTSVTEQMVPVGSVQADTQVVPVSEDAEPEIFVFQAVDPADPVLDKDVFSNVATLYDIYTIPAGEPVELPNQPEGYDNVPYYRLDNVQLSFLTAEEADRFVHKMLHCVRCLVAEYNAADKYKEQVTVRI